MLLGAYSLTSRSAPDSGSPQLHSQPLWSQYHEPVGWQQPQAPLGSTANHPRHNHTHHEAIPAMGDSSQHGQPNQELAPPIHMVTKAPGCSRMSSQLCRVWDICTSGPAATTQGRAWQPTRLGPAPLTRMPTVVSPTTTEGPTQPTEGAPLEHMSLETRRVCAAGSHRTSPT